MDSIAGFGPANQGSNPCGVIYYSSIEQSDIIKILSKLGFNSSKSVTNVRIQDQKEVKRFISLVGCANTKNIVCCKRVIKNETIPLKKQLIQEIIKLKINRPFKEVVR